MPVFQYPIKTPKTARMPWARFKVFNNTIIGRVMG